MPDRVRGEVIWFNSQKGYGFIRVPGRDAELFVHYTAIKMTGYKFLEENDKVEFVIVDGKRGPQAEDVMLLPFGVGVATA